MAFEDKYRLLKIGYLYAPQVGGYIGAMSSFYRWRYLKMYHETAVLISEEPDFSTKDRAKRIIDAYKMQKIEEIDFPECEHDFTAYDEKGFTICSKCKEGYT